MLQAENPQPKDSRSPSRERPLSRDRSPDRRDDSRERRTSPRRRRSRERSFSQSRSPRHYSRSRSPRRRSTSRGGENRRESPDMYRSNNDGNVLYIAGLSSTTREQDLQDICSKFGEVMSVNIIYDPRLVGESRGFGFVTMSSDKEADEVVTKLHGRNLDGKPLTIEKH